MAFEITRIDVWVGEVEDRPGALAEKLEAVMRAGADLDFVIVRPAPDKPGVGILYLAPLFGKAQTQAAQEVDLRKSHIQALRLLGPDRPGLSAGIARLMADAGLNISGLTGARVGDRCVFYLRFETESELTRAAQILAAKLA